MIITGYWWATFKDRAPHFVYGLDETAARVGANALGEVLTLQSLPYVPMGAQSPDGALDFCVSPERCAGRTACPRDYSCTE